MTSARRERKARLPRALVLAASAVLLAAGAVLPTPRAAAMTDRIVVDPNTGLAISGFDPVAYFVDHLPRLGRSGLELDYADTVWRFDNIGNRAAFAAHPEVYMPQFGGYDPIAIVRGAGTPGHPLIWLVSGQRLYLFYSVETRDAFAANPERAFVEAERAWPRVRHGLAR